MEGLGLEDDRSGRRSVLEEAAHWRDVLSAADVSLARKQEFDRWLEAHPDHQAAYRSVDRLLVFANRNGSDPGLMQLRREMTYRLSKRVERASRVRWLAVGATVAGLVAAAAYHQPFEDGWPFRSPEATFARTTLSTAVGERVSTVLEDGSRILLNTQSAVQVKLSATERRIVLTEGQAFFEVAKDPERPFIVEAGGHQVVAVGTAFDVRRDQERTQVTMKEGIVRVSAPGAQGVSQLISLTAGEQLSIDGSHVGRVKSVDVDAVFSWNQGRIVFDATPLEQAVSEINRYSNTKILIADPAISGLAISGSFSAGRPELFVEAVVTYFSSITATYQDQSISLVAKE